jgi:hypothetical protein
MDEAQLKTRVESVDAVGKDRFGANWGEMLSALSRANLGDAVKQVIGEADVVDRISHTSRNVLLNEMQSDDRSVSATPSAFTPICARPTARNTAP